MATTTQSLNRTGRTSFKLNAQLLFSLLILHLSVLVHGQTSSPECATPEPTAEQYQAYKASLDAFIAQQSINSSPTNTPDEVYEIPIHLIVIFDSNGNPPYSDASTAGLLAVTSLQDCIENTARNLDYINLHLHPRLRFYICQVDQINDSDLYDMQSPEMIVSSIISNHSNVSLPNNMVNLVLNNENYGVGSFPHAIKMPAYDNQGPFALHEFGHYFGLYHTFQGTSGNCNGIATVRLYPDHSPNLACPPWGDVPITCADTDGDGFPNYGKCFGDLIEDTPVDVFCNYTQALDDVDCVKNVNGENYVYHPDYANAMSYWLDTRKRLTSEQMQRVIDVFEIPNLGLPPFGGDMSNLVNDVMPICGEFVIVGDYPPAAGYVERVKYCPSSEEYITSSFGNGFVSTIDGVGGSVNRINDGIFLIPKLPSQVGATTTRCSFRSMIPAPFDFLPDWEHFYANYDVSIVDVILIRWHILGLAELPKPYGWIAADVNNSASISTLDLIQMQKIILGIVDDFDNVPAWRFVPKYALGENFNFAAPFYNNPFSAVWVNNNISHSYLSGATNSYLGGKEQGSNIDNVRHFTIDRTASYARNPDTWSFYAVKTGDVSSNACEDEDEGTNVNLVIPSHSCLVSKKKPAKLIIKFNQDIEYIEGLQLELGMDLELFETISLVEDGDGIVSDEDLHFNHDVTRVVWFNKGNAQSIVNVTSGDAFVELYVTPKDDICDLNDVIKLGNPTFNTAVVNTEGKEGKYTPTVLKELSLSVEVSLETESSNVHEVLNVFPNPTSSNTINFELDLANIAPVSVQLWDMYGNNTYSELGMIATGTHQLQALSTTGFAPGVVYYLVRIGSEVYSGYFMKI